jgi:hypothetical protein
MGPLNGSGGTRTQVIVPSGLTSGTVANTVPHSVMGDLVVGNYDLVGVPASGNAFLSNTSTGTGVAAYTIFPTGSFGTPTYFAPRGESVTILSHFQGISGLSGGGYSLIAMTVDSGSNPIGVDYVEVTRNGDGSFSRGDWVPLAVPGAFVHDRQHLAA